MKPPFSNSVGIVWMGPLRAECNEPGMACKWTLSVNRTIIFFPRWFLHFQHVDPTEAVCIHEDIKSRHSLGIHWGTFPTGYEVLNGSQKLYIIF